MVETGYIPRSTVLFLVWYLINNHFQLLVIIITYQLICISSTSILKLLTRQIVDSKNMNILYMFKWRDKVLQTLTNMTQVMYCCFWPGKHLPESNLHFQCAEVWVFLGFFFCRHVILFARLPNCSLTHKNYHNH